MDVKCNFYYIIVNIARNVIKLGVNRNFSGDHLQKFFKREKKCILSKEKKESD